MADVRLKDELQKMEREKEPLLPIEKKLIWYTFGTGVILLFVLVAISRAYL
ncbi:MAG: hypothetical protein LAN64_07710 [Acidobacteriia bacterium]|nr:hypothetical protein [Terriglobia bacterium]